MFKGSDGLRPKKSEKKKDVKGPSSPLNFKTWRFWKTATEYYDITAASITAAQAKFIDEHNCIPVGIGPATDDKGRPLPPPGFEYIEK